MKPEAIQPILEDLFNSENVSASEGKNWQVTTPQIKLLVLLSEDESWLRLLVPIAPEQEAKSFLSELMEANFDLTHEVRYGLNQGVLWGVFQHSLAGLTEEDLKAAIAQLVYLNEIGLLGYFNDVVEERLKQIIKIAKMQGQTKESTLQQITRFYEEGLMGGLEQLSSERADFLKAWEEQLERLWPEL